MYSELLLSESEKCITIQLIQCANLLVHNLKNENSINYLLSTDFYREILSHPFDFTDDEIIENYLSLLKGLAVNLSLSQLRDYILNNHYTLFTGAMMFFNNHESLIKTASRTVVLHILSSKFYTVNDEVIDKFILESGFFFNLVSNLKESIINIERSNAVFNSLSKLDCVIGESLDLLYHFNDIFSQNREIFNLKLSDVLLKVLILPILIGSLIEKKLNPYHLPIPLALYMLSQILNILKYPWLTETLISLFFDPLICQSYYDVILSPPNRDSPPLQISETKIENPVSLEIFSYLRCKEDNLTGLSLWLFQSALLSSENLMDLQEDQEKSYKYITILQEILTSDFEFRFFTSFLASKLLFELSFKQLPSLNGQDHQIIKSALSKKAENMKFLLNSYKNIIHIIRIFEEQ